MTYKDDLKKWVLSGIEHHGGSAGLVDVAKYIWAHHEDELRRSGDSFYTWQYDMRWAAQDLRNEGILAGADQVPRGIWRKQAAIV